MELLCGGARARGLRQTSHSAMHRGFLPPFFVAVGAIFFHRPLSKPSSISVRSSQMNGTIGTSVWYFFRNTSTCLATDLKISSLATKMQGVATSALNCLKGLVRRLRDSTKGSEIDELLDVRPNRDGALGNLADFNTSVRAKALWKKRFCVFPYAGEVFPPRWGVLEKPV